MSSQQMAGVTTPTPLTVARRRRSLLRSATANPLVVIGGGFLTFVLALIAIGPFFAVDPLQQNLLSSLAPPSEAHWAGTDNLGRDVLSRVLHGGRYSLRISSLSLLLAMSAGSMLGILSGMQRNAFTRLIDATVDFLMAFPTMVVGILAAAVFGNNAISLVGAIGVAITPRMALIVRTRVLTVARTGYIESAHVAGASPLRIISHHVLPNVAGSVLVIVTVYFPVVISLEASLSYLGLGISPDMATWGRVIADGQSVFVIAPWVSTAPGVLMVIASLAFNLLGDGLRDILDPKLQTRGSG